MSEHVDGACNMKNNNKNYIKEFMKENNIKINMPFEIEGNNGYTVCERCFIDENLLLYTLNEDKGIKVNETLFLFLLAGEYKVASKIKMVARILGVEMNEPFKVRETEFLGIATVSKYTLTENGLIDSKGKPAPEYLTHLLTGQYVIVED